MNERLYRSVDDRVLAGVCGGIAARLAVDPSLIRIAYAVVALLTGIFPLLILYAIMAAVIPEEPTGFAGRSPTPPGADPVPGWAPPTAAGAAWSQSPGPGWPPPADGPAWPPPAEGPAWPPPADGAPIADAAELPLAAADAAGADETHAGTPAPAPTTWAATPTASPTRRGDRADRPGSTVAGIIGGVVLVGLGVWFLVRDRLDIDWGVVWAAGLVALGVVIVIAALRPRR